MRLTLQVICAYLFRESANFEVTMAFADADFAGKVRQMLEQDFGESQLVTAQDLKERGFWFRFPVCCAWRIAPFQ